MDLHSKMTISELIRIHPSSLDVFIKRKMLCVGCPTESFHTIEDVSCIYGIDLNQLMRELCGVFDTQEHENLVVKKGENS